METSNIDYRNSELREVIQECSDSNHKQQVAYSTWHDALTQVCFTCGRVRTTSEELQDEVDNQ
jgi:hypothetical protein